MKLPLRLSGESTLTIFIAGTFRSLCSLLDAPREYADTPYIHTSQNNNPAPREALRQVYLNRRLGGTGQR